MAHIGTIESQHAGSRAGLRRWRSRGAPLVRRFRKPLVAASLVAGDLLSAYAAMWCAAALLSVAGFPALDDRRLMSIALLIGAFFVARLYTAWGPSPYERLRLRALCIAAVAALDLIAQRAVPRDIAALFLALLCNAACLL